MGSMSTSEGWYLEFLCSARKREAVSREYEISKERRNRRS